MGGKINGNYVGDLKCWPFSEPRRVRGLWLIQFEASTFYPGATSYDQVEKKRPTFWLETSLLDREPLLDAGQGGEPLAYVVDAEGRESLCNGWFGHMGLSQREFVAEHFYSLRRVPVDGR